MLPIQRMLELFERFVLAAERIADATEYRNMMLSGALRNDAAEMRPEVEVNGHGARER